MSVMLMFLAAVYGAAAGLLIPRPVHRLAVEPEEEWRAVCPGGHPITGPARGWLGRGCCPDCGAYGPGPLPTAAATALVCAALAAATGPRPELVAWLVMAPVAVLLAAVDWRARRLPDVLTLPLAAAGAALLGPVGWLTGETAAWRRALLGGLLLGAWYLVLYLVNPRGIGLGDVKLAVGLGIALGWYGWRTLVTGGAAGVLLGALYAAALLLVRREARKAVIPLGPFMIIGAFCGLLPGAAAAA
ncbi:prepilin peptidase [Streptomyces glebosus]|uniref:Prepilin peptidase n=2 Tax=Streptomyces glebosus TaxID=249580 RepID=A0A640SUH4_9ACTN|nr:prepilin peptidase [Streptomyces glebosus]GFE14650.1 prepilin peptidase [Streptomyces glebosus]GHG69384.1 prepilin peptidase [Streptomyces glebosus]